MGIYNKAFSFFNKGVGVASGFAKNHMFPAMKTDYMAAKAGFVGARRAFTGGGSTISRSFADQGFIGAVGTTAGLTMGAGRRSYQAMMGSYRGAGVSPLQGGLRMGGYGAAGMWGLSSGPETPPRNLYRY